MDPTGPSQPPLEQSYKTPGNAASAQPAEQASKLRQQADDSAGVEQRVPQKQTTYVPFKTLFLPTESLESLFSKPLSPHSRHDTHPISTPHPTPPHPTPTPILPTTNAHLPSETSPKPNPPPSPTASTAPPPARNRAAAPTKAKAATRS